jgi:hypothetical protein
MDFLTVLRTLGDRVLGWICIAGGALALLLGYLGVKDTAYVVEQLPYVVSGGLLGLFLLGVGATLLLSADLRDQWRALLDIRDEIAAGTAELPAAADLPDEQPVRRVRQAAGGRGAGSRT